MFRFLPILFVVCVMTIVAHNTNDSGVIGNAGLIACVVATVLQTVIRAAKDDGYGG